MHDWDPNAMGLSLDPFLPRPKRNSPVSQNILTSRCDYSSSAGCIKIQPIPSVLQSVLIKVSSPGSNIAKTSEDITTFLNLLNNFINAGAQSINEFGFL